MIKGSSLMTCSLQKNPFADATTPMLSLGVLVFRIKEPNFKGSVTRPMYHLTTIFLKAKITINYSILLKYLWYME